MISCLKRLIIFFVMENNIFKKFNYSITKYNFRELIEVLFGTKDLENLHKTRPELMPNYQLKFENESQTNFHSTFYSKLNSNWKEFTNLYEQFIKDEIYSQFNKPILYQYAPTFRAQIPDDQAIHKWHFDSDEDHNHPQGEINYCIAITDMFDTTAIWIESSPGKKDFKPMEIKFGEYQRFNGNRCTHGNKINKTKTMRFSLDFRILPQEKYKYDVKKNFSLTSGKKFEINDYYRTL